MTGFKDYIITCQSIFSFKKVPYGWAQWLTPAMEIRRIVV
jgi:hypothetical protein